MFILPWLYFFLIFKRKSKCFAFKNNCFSTDDMLQGYLSLMRNNKLIHWQKATTIKVLNHHYAEMAPAFEP